jgi:hypothetical protein
MGEIASVNNDLRGYNEKKESVIKTSVNRSTFIETLYKEIENNNERYRNNLPMTVDGVYEEFPKENLYFADTVDKYHDRLSQIAQAVLKQPDKMRDLEKEIERMIT